MTAKSPLMRLPRPLGRLSGWIWGRVLALLACTVVLSADPVRISATVFGGTGNDALVAVAFAPDGTLVVLGVTTGGTWNLPGGVVPTVLGVEGTDTTQSTPFIARFSNDGKTLLSVTRFGWGSLRLNGSDFTARQLAVNANGIYLIAWGTSQLAGLRTSTNVTDFGTASPVSGVLYPMAIRLSSNGATVQNAVILRTASDSTAYHTTGSVYDGNAIDLFPNGDVMVSFGRVDSNFDYVARLTPDFVDKVWYRWDNRVQGATGGAANARVQTAVVAADGSRVYTAGYAQGDTGQEPYKDGYIFAFDGSTGAKLWDRTPGNTTDNDYGVYNFLQASIGANRLISDTTVNTLGTDAAGNLLVGAFSDGGASVLAFQPMDGGLGATTGPQLTSAQQDGDSWASLGSATRVAIVGRLKPDGTWAMSQRLRGTPGIYASARAVAPMWQDKVISGGRGPDLQDINQWDLGSQRPAGYLMKTSLSPGNGGRSFLTHMDGVDAINGVARDRTTHRYAAVGTAFDPAGASPCGTVRAIHAVQPSFGGGTTDGYLVVFNDDETSAGEWTVLHAQADASICPAENANVNYGSAVSVAAHIRDYSDYWAATTSKVFIRFDLSGVTSDIVEVGLECWRYERYSLGNLRVYGLQEGLDGWNENTLTWNLAPANPSTGDRAVDWQTMSASGATDLGQWNVTNTITNHTELWTSAALVTFLNQARANGDKLATVVLTTTTLNNEGVVFTSREGASGSSHPPRLRFRTANQAMANTAPSIQSAAIASPSVIAP